MRILIIDDDSNNRFLLQKILTPFGECFLEDNGKKALGAVVAALSAKTPFDLICLDIMMPEMNGQEVLRLIREIEAKWGVPPGREVKVVMITALDDAKEATKAFFKGCATAYLLKPIKKNDLVELVRAIMAKSCSGTD